MLIGRCTHKDARYIVKPKNLNYSAGLTWRVFRKCFTGHAACGADGLMGQNTQTAFDDAQGGFSAAPPDLCGRLAAVQ